MSAPLNQTAAVVTGASSGIGQAIAVALADAGAARVLVHYRKNRSGAEHTEQLLKQRNCEAFLCSADLSVEDDRTRLVEAALAHLGEIHTWVNNAGVDVLTGEMANASFSEKLDRLWQVDVRGTMLLARQVADVLKTQSAAIAPSMIFIGWDQAPCGMEGDAGIMFGPIKSAVMAFANSLAQTLAPHVRVNTIAPGWIQTAWGDETSDYWNRRAQQQSLMGRWGKPEDVARAAVYLADPSNSFVTGQTIEVNGGWNRTFE
ncbi:MAG: SDR family oxidoreductase [Planctomycetota bacterium]